MAEPTLPDSRPGSQVPNTTSAAPDGPRGDGLVEARAESVAAGDVPELAGAGLPGGLSRRLTAGDARVLLLWVLVAVVGASVAYRYFFRAFPEAAVDFKVTRGAALSQARDFAGPGRDGPGRGA